MAGEIKQMMFGGKGNTQIIGIPHDKCIKEMQRKDAEIARLTDELTSALKQTQDTGTQNDLQARLQVLQRERHALQDRLRDPNRAYQEHMQRGAQLAQILENTAQRQAIGENRIRSAMIAFENYSYEELIALFTEAERLGRLQAAESAFALGLIEESALDWNAAYNHYKRAYNFDNDNPQYAHAYAIIASRMGRYPEAVQIFETALQQVRDAGQEGTEDHAKALNNLATLYSNQGDFARAEPMYEEALSISRRVLGTDHPDTASSLNKLANLYSDKGYHKRAEPMFKEALSIRRRVLGNDHPDTAMSLNNLASLYYAQEDFARAKPMYEEALSIRRRVLGNDHPDTAQSLNNLAYLHTIQGGFARAEPMYEEALSIHRRVLGTDHPDTASSLNNLASLYYNQGDLARAKPMYEEAIGIMIDAFPDGHPDADGYKSNYWQLLKQLRD